MKKRPEEGDIYRGKNLTPIFGSKCLNCDSNLHTFSGGSVIFDQCHMVWRAVAVKLQHVWTCLSHSWGDEGMTLLNLYYHGQGNWLVSSIILVESFLATESPCYIVGCESRWQLQASDIFRETSG